MELKKITLEKNEKQKLRTEAMLKKRVDECSECYIMANYEDPDKWSDVEKCPKCAKNTQILKKSWD